MEIRKKDIGNPMKREHPNFYQFFLFIFEIRILKFVVPNRKDLRKSQKCRCPMDSRKLQPGRNQDFNQWGYGSICLHVHQISPSEKGNFERNKS